MWGLNHHPDEYLSVAKLSSLTSCNMVESEEQPHTGLTSLCCHETIDGRTTKHNHTPSTKAEQLSRHSCNQTPPRERHQREKLGQGATWDRPRGERRQQQTERGANKSQTPNQRKRSPPTSRKEHKRSRETHETHRQKY